MFGAGGSIGAAVAREFAAEGAAVFLAGRTKSNVDEVTKQITAAGGKAHAAVIDVLNEGEVSEYIEAIVKQTGKIDLLLDATGAAPASMATERMPWELPIDELMVPLTTMVKSRFITARAAARYVIKQHSCVIIFVTGSPARGHVPGATAIGPAFGAIENLTENLAFEVSPFGIRVVCVRTLADSDSRSIQGTMDFLTGQTCITKDQAMAQIAQSNFLKTPATVQDTAS